MLVELADAGMDLARVPLAHGTIADAVARVRRLRSAVPEIGIMIDLPGPKIRTAPFADGGIMLVPGQRIAVGRAEPGDHSTAQRIAVDHDQLVDDLAVGDTLAVGDGGVVLVVVERAPGSAVAEVRSGGLVQGKPGLTAPNSRISFVTPTPEDLRRLTALAAEGVDAVAVSFVRSAADIQAVRDAVGADGPMLIAKIETEEGVRQLDRIVAIADGVMVARGDLGVRMALEEVPHIQKRIIRSGVRFGRPVITATQMLESMVTAPVPTRAEVTDVANAVLDGTSAVMLSAETAVGADPVLVVRTMARIAARAERDFDYVGWGTDLGAQEIAGAPSSPARITAAATAAGWRAAMEEDAAVIIACTRSGNTARAISRFRPAMPLLACTPSERTARQLCMSWGVETVVVGEAGSTDEIVWISVQAAVEAGYARSGDVVVVLAGSPIEPEPATDTLRLVRIR